ncbi:hypothetical protein LSO07_27425 [Janthinobacterium sp. PLB04]|uniref:O-antigen ligase-related domain-containing protein n=1 Tax=Janthinobacterium lividum TaxID=29581 RepID=A0AAJ4MSE3_9BURK|nr:MULTISPECIES: O-antigen ligase family protein [Janthinobacterium]KAB0327128.1 hypothetical protein F3B38_27080 [Janthinobacterium lividum]QSX96268.1 hypothetical protein J3P46_27275 [Janthinobacterium lividum]UGQ36140.1 hypothetical protein LSO07_27425 [Janthinobacterium sp. PLB04]
MPMALLDKFTIAGSEFSASYIFVFCMIVTFLFFALLSVRRNFPVEIDKNILCVTALAFNFLFFSLLNEPDGGFFLGVSFWIVSIFIGLNMDISGRAKFVKIVFFLAWILSIVGLVLYFLNLPLLDLKTAGRELYFLNSNGYYRASSVFLNPNSFAYFLVFYFCIFSVSKKYGVKNCFIFLIVFFAFYFSESRSAMLSLFLILLFSIFLKAKPVNLSRKLYAINVFILLVLLFLLLLSGDLFSYDIRFEKWHMALDIFFGNYEYLLKGIPFSVPLYSQGITFSDNMFLYILFRLGFFGFFGFFIFYIFVVKKSCTILAYESTHSQSAPYAMYFLVSSVSMFYSNFLLFYPIMILHGIAIGIVLQETNVKSRCEKK